MSADTLVLSCNDLLLQVASPSYCRQLHKGAGWCWLLLQPEHILLKSIPNSYPAWGAVLLSRAQLAGLLHWQRRCSCGRLIAGMYGSMATQRLY